MFLNTMHTIITKKQMTKVKREEGWYSEHEMRNDLGWTQQKPYDNPQCNIHTCSLLVIWFQYMGCMVAEHCCIQVKGGWGQEPLHGHAWDPCEASSFTWTVEDFFRSIYDVLKSKHLQSLTLLSTPNKYRCWDHLVRNNAYDGVKEFFVTVRETSERTTELSDEETHKKAAKAPGTCLFSGLATLVDLTGHGRSVVCRDWDDREQVPGLGSSDQPRSGWGQGSSRWSKCGSLHAGLVLPKQKDIVRSMYTTIEFWKHTYIVM